MGGEDERRRRAAAAYQKTQKGGNAGKGPPRRGAGDDGVVNDAGAGNRSARKTTGAGEGGTSGRSGRGRRGKAAGSAAGESGGPGPSPDGSAASFEKVGTPPTRARPRRTAPPGAITAEALEAAGAERAARLLIALGAERAARVLSGLRDKEIEQIAAAIVKTPAVRASEAQALLETIGESSLDRPVRGGPEVAREMLIAAFGEERGESLFHSAVPDATRHFQFLGDVEPHQLRLLMKDESPGAIAVIAAHIEPAKAAELLNELPQELRADVARKVARMGRLSREVVVRIEEAMREKIRQQGRQVTQSVDGSEKLAGILRHMAPSAEGDILRALELVEPEVTREVRDHLFTTDLLLAISERDLADLMREFDDGEIALLLKGKPEALRSRVLRAVSDRRRMLISEEYAHLGAQKREDVDAITHEVLERLRELEEDGTILVPRDGDKYI
jgi:flagellar motor switch protein FliG